MSNRFYTENFGDRGFLPLPPSRQFAILTCMDARLDPAKYAGLAEGDAHVIRNTGGLCLYLPADNLRSSLVWMQDLTLLNMLD
jgi:carbonic anhydrase